jgi:hypothetical protein
MCLGRHKCGMIVGKGSITGCRVAAAIRPFAETFVGTGSGEVVEPETRRKVLSTLSSQGTGILVLACFSTATHLGFGFGFQCMHKAAAIVRRSIPGFNGSTPDSNNNRQQ